MQKAGSPAQPVPLDTSELTEAEKKRTMRTGISSEIRAPNTITADEADPREIIK